MTENRDIHTLVLNIVRGVAIKTALLTTLAAIFSVIILLLQGGEGLWMFTAGLIIGGGLSVMNFRWLAFTVEWLYLKKNRQKADSGILRWPVTIIKLSAIFFILFILIKYKLVNLIALVIGLSLSFLAIMWEGFRVMSGIRGGSE